MKKIQAVLFMRCLLLICMVWLKSFVLFAQQKPIEELTRQDIMAMSFDELSAYSLEDQMRMADIAGVNSKDDLFRLVLDKDISIASKNVENYFVTPLSTSVLSADDIERSGVRTIPEAMRLIPGVLVREKTNGNYDVQISNSSSIGGQQSMFSENAMTAVMLDGLPVYTYITGGMFWESLPISVNDIERIEIIRGAAGAMYGANAVSGVISIITKHSAAEKASVQVSGTTGGYFNGASPLSGGGTSTGYIGAVVNVNGKLRVRASVNQQERERSQSDIFYYTTNGMSAFEPSSRYFPVDSAAMFGVDHKNLFTDYRRSLHKIGLNAQVTYMPADLISFDLSAGSQLSSVISSNLDLYFFAHTERDLATNYVNLKSELYGVQIQAAYTWGDGNLSRSVPGMNSDIGNIFINAEYSYKWNKLAINTGFNFSRNALNGKSSAFAEQSFFTGRSVLNSWAPSLRLDYRPIDALRLIGAFRLEKNSIPNHYYPTWQLVANYVPSENLIVRGGYSRANRSPFMIDVGTNSSVNVKTGRDGTTTEVFMNGNPNLRLTTVDMFELGFRLKIGQHLMLNAETYYSELRDMNTAQLTDMRINFAEPDYTFMPLPYYLNYRFVNLPEVQHQAGITADLGVVVNDRLNFRLWGTGQYTTVKRHMDPDHQDYLFMPNEPQHYYIPTMMGYVHKMFNDYISLFLKNNGNAEQANVEMWQKYHLSETDPYRLQLTLEDIENDGEIRYVDKRSKASPAFYGGFEVNWRPVEKIELVGSGYGFTRYHYSNQLIPLTAVDAKFLLNARVNYHFTDNLSLSFTANNLLNDRSVEFAYMDETGMQWYLGFNCKF